MVGWVAGCMYVLTDFPLYGCPVFQTPACPTYQSGGLLDVQLVAKLKMSFILFKKCIIKTLEYAEFAGKVMTIKDIVA